MITAIPEDLLAAVDAQQQQAFQAHYAALVALATADCPLEEFLSQFLGHLVQLYRAVGGTLWLRSPGETKVAMRSSVGPHPLGEEAIAAREALVRFGLGRNTAFLVEPHSTLDARSAVGNPSDDYRLFGPIESQGDRIGVLELNLGPTWAEGKTVAGRLCQVAWLNHLTRHLGQGLENRFLGNLAPLQPALVNLAATRAEIEGFKRAIRVSLEVTLNGFAGWNFGSLNNNRTFTKSVQELLDSNGLRVECPECGTPAILRCQPAGNAKTGVFLYDHSLDSGRTFHGGRTTFPKLKLVPKPPRRAAK